MPRYDDYTLTELKEHMPEYLEAVCGVTDLRRPFRCLTPSHEDRHPSMSYDPRTRRVRCFGCGAGGDVFEMAGWVEGAVGFSDKVEAVARAVGYPLNTACKTKGTKRSKAPQRPAYDKPRPLCDMNLMNEMQRAVWALLEEPQGRAALDYLHRRGFDDRMIAGSFIGWVEHPSVLFPGMKAPWCDDGYIALFFPDLSEHASAGEQVFSYPHHVAVPYVVFRSANPGAEPKELKPYGLVAPLWREHLLTGICDPGTPVYVTEGVFDAMSLMALYGVQACATCGAGTRRLLEVVAHTPKNKRPRLKLSFDADRAGRGFTDTVSNGLKELGVPYDIAPPYPYGCKDANELLILECGRHE